MQYYVILINIFMIIYLQNVKKMKFGWKKAVRKVATILNSVKWLLAYAKRDLNVPLIIVVSLKRLVIYALLMARKKWQVPF